MDELTDMQEEAETARAVVTEQQAHFGAAPSWVDSLTDQEIINMVAESDSREEFVARKVAQKGICYIHRRSLRTSEQKNEEYDLRVWGLNTTEILQSASIQEHGIGPRDDLAFNRVKVIRDGKIVDKASNLTTRTLSDEKSSQRGMLLKASKVHCVISDLRLGDIMILETHKVTRFDEKNEIDKHYYRFVQLLPAGYWFYGNYDFSFFQERSKEICVSKRYFRDAAGEFLPQEETMVKKGESFKFSISDYRNEDQDIFSPMFEMATVATWEEISTYVDSLYKETFSKHAALHPDQSLRQQLSSTDDIEQKIRRVIEYVQDNIVYLHDAEVMHAHVPQSAQEVTSNKSGDCKAKSLLLVRLLEQVGIPSNITLVNYGYDRYIGRSLPSPFVFNHAIVRVERNGKEYFIDPTWSNRAGLLENRAEPLFSTYLEIKSGATLGYKSEIASPTLNTEENTTITIKRGVGKVELAATYRCDSADIERGNIRNNTNEQLLRYKNSIMRGRLQYGKDKEDSELFANTTYRVVHDDKDKNELSVLYKTDLLQPVRTSNGYLTFRYYYPFNDNQILGYSHKDAPLISFMGFSTRDSLQVISNRIFLWRYKVTKKELEIDNKYFSFSNKKRIRFLSASVTSEFRPKRYAVIPREDLAVLREDIRKIGDSNYGIGVLYLNNFLTWFNAFWSYAYIGLVMIIVIGMIISGLISTAGK